MKYRKLRIAWSVGWGVACLLLIALWVRSYRRADFVRYQYSESNCLQIVLARGRIDLNLTEKSPLPLHSINQMHLVLIDGAGRVQGLPAWILLMLLGLAGAAPWFRCRFSLRTLLIGMTVAAIGLGWLVYALRK